MEFYGPGVSQLSIADRATISNMCPEYGATVGFFAVDDMSLKYLKQTGEDYGHVSVSLLNYSGNTANVTISCYKYNPHRNHISIHTKQYNSLIIFSLSTLFSQHNQPR